MSQVILVQEPCLYFDHYQDPDLEERAVHGTVLDDREVFSCHPGNLAANDVAGISPPFTPLPHHRWTTRLVP